MFPLEPLEVTEQVFIFAIYYVTVFGNGSLTIVFLNLRFNAWFVNFDCISKSLNVEWKQFSPLIDMA